MFRAIGPQYSDLLEAAGVGSPAELAQRNPANLAITVQEVVAARPGIVHRLPTEAEITAWVEAAADARQGGRTLTTARFRGPGPPRQLGTDVTSREL